MSSYNSINTITNYNNYYEVNNRASNTSDSNLFNNIISNAMNNLNSIANVPTGRQSNYSSNYSRSVNSCPVHGNCNTNSATELFNNSSSNISSSNISSTRASQTQKAIQIAKSHLGGKYVWGATGPNAFDCSGFTQYIYKKAYGKNIPRVSYEQAKYGKKVEKKDLQPGDLLFFDTMNKGRVSHVGIYIGNNKFIHAASSKSGIIESELSGYYNKKYMGARRP